MINTDEQKLQAHLLVLGEQRANLFEIIGQEDRAEELRMLRNALLEINEQISFLSSRLSSGSLHGLADTMSKAKDREELFLRSPPPPPGSSSCCLLPPPAAAGSHSPLMSLSCSLFSVVLDVLLLLLLLFLSSLEFAPTGSTSP